jgi:hypothetical protein
MRSFITILLAASMVPILVDAAAGQATPTGGGRSRLTADQALDLIRKGRWVDAVDAYAGVLEANPFRGTSWYYYGLAQHRAGDCGGALAAYERAIELGVNRGRSGMSAAMSGAARCAAALGDLDEAFRWLREASGRWEFSDWDTIERDPNFAQLIAEDRFRLLAGRLGPDEVDRDMGWRFDIDYLADLVVRRHPQPFHSVDEASWRDRVSELRAAVASLTDVEIFGRLKDLLAAIGDGHTSLYPPSEGPLALHQLPVWPYRFGQEWHILAAAPEHANLVGARIVEVNGAPATVVFEAMERGTPKDNEQTFAFVGAMFAQFTESYYLAVGSGSPTATEFALEFPDGQTRQVVLEGGPFMRNPNARWAPEGWPSMTDMTAPPLWLSRLDEMFWFTDLDEGVVYAQVNQIAHDDEERFEEFVARLDAHLRASGIRHLILDLRLNNGGNGYLNWELVRALVRNEAIDRDGGLYVLIGRRTFSAAVLLTGDLDRLTHARFVGEPPSSPPNFYGNDSGFTLPYSGLQGSITNGYHQRSTWEDLSPWTAPDLWTPLTVEDAFAGRDPALQAVLAQIRGQV